MGVSETSAGAKAVPDAIYSGLVTGMNRTNPMRRFSTRLTTETGNALHVPLYDDSSVEAVQVPENAQAAAADVEINAIQLGAHKLHSRILVVSGELLEDGGPAVEFHLGSVLGRRLSRLARQLYTTGSGEDEPTGILTAATIKVEATAPNAITYGELLDLRFLLEAGYDEASQWMMAPSSLKAIMNITDDANRPVFTNELLFGKPVILNDSMPAIEAEATPILFGDLRSYISRETSETMIRRYDEKYAPFGQVGLAAIHRIDGNLADAKGVAVLQMADA